MVIRAAEKKIGQGANLIYFTVLKYGKNLNSEINYLKILL